MPSLEVVEAEEEVVEAGESMRESIKESIKLNASLLKMDEDAITRLYLRVFNTDDGELVLQDLMNRCHFYTPTTNTFDEGQRSVIMSIQNRLSNLPQPEGDKT